MLEIAAAPGGTSGKTKITVTAGSEGNTLKYRKNPSSRAVYGMSSSDFGGTSLTSGTAQDVSDCKEGDIIEAAEFSTAGCVSVGYITLKASDIK